MWLAHRKTACPEAPGQIQCLEAEYRRQHDALENWVPSRELPKKWAKDAADFCGARTPRCVPAPPSTDSQQYTNPPLKATRAPPRAPDNIIIVHEAHEAFPGAAENRPIGDAAIVIEIYWP
jgi:hypothetical protein